MDEEIEKFIWVGFLISLIVVFLIISLINKCSQCVKIQNKILKKLKKISQTKH
jgi:cell division protein FtsL